MFKQTYLASAVLLALSSQVAFAAEDNAATKEQQAADDMEVIQVVGIRSSLNKAVNLKRQNVQVVDAIVAEDIGKFPDNNVVEALQRVTGVQVTDRASGEVNTVTIRGLTDVTTTVNGREMFTAAGRSLAVADIPAALLETVEVYKTRSASQLESGIAGQLDVRTQRPFNFEGAKFVMNARGVYQDQAEKTDPIVSALVSNRWDSSIGELGALLNVSYTRTNYRDQSATPGAFVPFRADNLERMFPDRYDWTPGLEHGLDTTPGSTIHDSATGDDVEYLLSRDAIFQSDFTGKRERPAVNLSLQWAPNDTSEYLFEGFYNGYRNESFNNLLFSFADWWGAPASTYPELYDGTNVIHSRGLGAPYSFTSGDLTKSQTDTYMFALGGKWDLSADTTIKSELVYQTSEYKTEFLAMRTDTVLPYLDVNFNEKDGTLAWDVLTGEGGESVALTDPSMWNTAQMYDNGGKSKGDALTYTFDADLYLDWGIFTKAKAGLRYDLRTAKDYTRGLDGYNQQNLADLDPSMLHTNSGFFDGEANIPSSWVTINGHELWKNRDAYRELYGFYSDANAGQLDLEQTFDIEQTTWSFYAQSDFETELFGKRLDGQIGVRYTHAKADMTFFNVDAAEGEENTSDATNSSSKFLPNLVMRYHLTDDLLARFAYTETLRRPNFDQLNSFVRYYDDVTNIGYGTGSGGNKDLKPVESKNYDFSLEYYFGKGSSVYGTYFYRDIQGFVYSSLRRVMHENDDGELYPYIVGMPDNSSNGVLKGIEIGGVYFLENVPSWLDGFGIQASGTFLDSSQDLPNYEADGSLNGYTTRDIFGVSDSSYSAVLIYEKEDFSTRLSYVWRDAFLNGYDSGSFANPRGVYRRPEKSLDFQFSYNVTDDLVVTFDATNITNEKFQQYYEDENVFNAGTAIYSRTFGLGIRYSM
ncbi:TonB-dependent receptor [Shewanella mangrovi]|uniref:TonB-dependent receptor n=1 Tax=Shewanella mangrovi TaxID=1515746 RepID=A0A094JIH1_9GAMM|nr:TonB-dependent receptor [Shewanella mangrovi]KFZ38997.1 TonB-dependent receptor [Shewanella mangrovi]